MASPRYFFTIIILHLFTIILFSVIFNNPSLAQEKNPENPELVTDTGKENMIAELDILENDSCNTQMNFVYSKERQNWSITCPDCITLSADAFYPELTQTLHKDFPGRNKISFLEILRKEEICPN